MKISITNYGKTYSVESNDDHDIESVVDMLKGLLVSMGYHPCNVEDLLNTEYQWFTKEEIENNRQGHLSANSNPFMDAFKKGYEAKEFQETMYDQDIQEKVYQEKIEKIKHNE